MPWDCRDGFYSAFWRRPEAYLDPTVREGMSVLEYPPGIGNVWTDYTGTARSVRGRGIARALKCETVSQAAALGVLRVRTNNDGENKPILHLNEEMGYHRIRGFIQLLKQAPAG